MMNSNKQETDNKKRDGHTHSNHMWMMVACCAIPIIGFVAIGFLGISSPSLETLIAVICPIGMVGMMYMMNRDNKAEESNRSCCSTKAKNEEASDKEAEDQPIPIQQTSTLKA
jgi:hypothetical protein